MADQARPGDHPARDRVETVEARDAREAFEAKNRTTTKLTALRAMEDSALAWLADFASQHPVLDTEITQMTRVIVTQVFIMKKEVIDPPEEGASTPAPAPERKSDG